MGFFRASLLFCCVVFVSVSFANAQESIQCDFLAMDQESQDVLGKCLGGKAAIVKVLVLNDGLPQSDRIHRSINERAWAMRNAKLLVYCPAKESPLSAILRERLASQGVKVIPLPVSSRVHPMAPPQIVLANKLLAMVADSNGEDLR